MPEIRAQEALDAATRMAVATGHLKEAEAKRILNEWRRAANIQKPVVKLSLRETAAIAGICVVQEETDAGESRQRNT